MITGTPRIEKNIEYARSHGQTLTFDIFSPAEAGKGRPALVAIHGGQWSQLDKRMWSGEAVRFALEGMVAFCINYRMTNGLLALPSQIDNVRAALRFIRANADRFGIDPARISTFGGSAGGQLAALVAVEPDPAAPQARIRAVGVWSGFFDLVMTFERQRVWQRGLSAIELAIGGTPDEFPERYRLFAPITHVDKAPTPMLIAVSTDEVSPLRDSEIMAERLRAAGVACELVVLEGSLHSRECSPLLIERTVEFLKKHG